MPDYNKIKAEYLRGGVSIRKLAEKYGVSFSTLAKKQRIEKWTDLRTKSGLKRDEKIAESVARKEAKSADRIQNIADKLLSKIEEMIARTGEDAIGPTSVRNLTMSLKDIAQIKGYQTKLDEREQLARIAKLEKEAKEEEQTDNKVVVVIESGEERYDE